MHIYILHIYILYILHIDILYIMHIYILYILYIYILHVFTYSASCALHSIIFCILVAPWVCFARLLNLARSFKDLLKHMMLREKFLLEVAFPPKL